VVGREGKGVGEAAGEKQKQRFLVVLGMKTRGKRGGEFGVYIYIYIYVYVYICVCVCVHT